MRSIVKIILTITAFGGIFGCAGTGWAARNVEEVKPHYDKPHYEYVVKSGDALLSIAKRFGTTVRSIQAANPGLNHNRLRIGQKLIIPAKDTDITEAERSRAIDGDLESDGHDEWLDDFDTAQACASSEGKAILINFTGSDWCPWCKRLDEETLSNADFIRQASKRFILVVVDSPADKSMLSLKAQKINPSIVRRFNVRGFPTLVITDAQGSEITRLSGYVEGGPSALLGKLDQIQIPQVSNVRRVTKEGGNIGSGGEEQQSPGIKSKGVSRYKIVKFSRESGSQFSYRFVLALNNEENSSLQTLRLVQQEFREAVKADYIESFPITDIRSLRVDFPEYELDNGKITGRAVVLSISVTSLSYDPKTRTGRLAVKVNANQYEEARKWIRKNIETLAQDKNIALTTGQLPPAATYYSLGERIDGNVMEIEFKTE